MYIHILTAKKALHETPSEFLRPSSRDAPLVLANLNTCSGMLPGFPGP